MPINEKAQVEVDVDGKNAAQEINKIDGQLKKLNKRMNEARKANDKAGYDKLTREAKELRKEKKRLKTQTEQTIKVMDDLSKVSYNDLRNEARKLERQLKKMDQNHPKYKEYSQAAGRYNTKLKQMRLNMKGVTSGGSKMGGVFGKMKGMFAGMLPALGIGAIIGGLTKVGQEVNKVFEKRQQIARLTDKEGQDLADYTASVNATAQTFNKDFNEMSVAVNNFSKSMGIAEEDALALIEKGFISGADASGEFLSQLKEYGPQFKAAGLSADQSISLMTQSIKAGVFSDKGADAIKEGLIRLREMPKATQDAIDGIGLSSQEMMRKLRNGEMTVYEAMQQVSNKLGELPPQSQEVGTAIADVFAGPGEDAGLEFIKTIGKAQGGMDALVEKTGEVGQAQQNLLEANKELNKAWSDLIGTGTGTFDNIKASAKLLLADGINGIITGFRNLREWFIDFYNNSAVLRGVIQTVIGSVNQIFSGLKHGGEQVLNLFGGLGKVIKAVFTGNFSDVRGIVRDTFASMKTDAVEFAQDTADNWSDRFKETVEGKLKQAPIKAEVETEKTSTEVTTQIKKNQGGSPGTRRKESSISALESTGISHIQTAMEKEIAAYQALKAAQEKNQEKMTLTQRKESAKRMEDARKEMEARQQYAEQQTMLVQSISGQIGQAFGQMLTDQETSMKDFFVNMLIMSLDFLKQLAIQKIAEATIRSLAQPDSVASFGASGLARAAILTGLIEAAVGAIKAKVTQRATGKYDVIGQDDGRSYSAPYDPKPKTGIYSSPTLFAETGDELIVDPATTRNIQMNYPAILSAINNARVPQRAAGNYQPIERSQPAAAAQQPAPVMDERTLAVMENFTRTMDVVARNGVRGKWVIRDLEDKQTERNLSKNNVKR